MNYYYMLIIGIVLAGLLIIKSVNNFDDLGKQCDQAKGYTCTLYDVQNYAREGR